MSSQVFGIGIGSFILVTIWIIAFILCLIAIRTKRVIGFVALLIAIFITITLILIPKQTESKSASLIQKESDFNFIWHNLLATLFGLCSVGSIVLLFTAYGIEPIHTTRIRSWIIE